MKRKIILTESDIRNIVKKCVLEYYSKTNVDENRTANILTALGLAAGSVAGINKATNMPRLLIIRNKIRTIL